MAKEEEISRISRVLQDHEKRIAALEGRRPVKEKGTRTKDWYKPRSTIEKIVVLIEEGFFNKPRSMSEVVSELKTKDYHLKSADLTLPMRKVVRRGLLKKTKKNPDGSVSKNWLYVKV